MVKKKEKVAPVNETENTKLNTDNVGSTLTDPLLPDLTDDKPTSDRPQLDVLVGQIVLFVAGPEDKDVAKYEHDSPVAPAIVTQVYSSGCVNLTVFPDGRVPVCKKEVRFTEMGEIGTWTWR